jgi:hypothetical protein
MINDPYQVLGVTKGAICVLMVEFILLKWYNILSGFIKLWGVYYGRRWK